MLHSCMSFRIALVNPFHSFYVCDKAFSPICIDVCFPGNTDIDDVAAIVLAGFFYILLGVDTNCWTDLCKLR